MPDADVDARILEFERSWRRGVPPDIAEVLERPPALAPRDRAALLVELVCVDLEFRWRGGPGRERTTLEGYAARHPGLGPVGRVPVDVIGEEYRVRCRWGDRPTHADVLSRFPDRRDEVRAELARVDAELREESAVPRSPPTRGDGGPAFGDDDDPGLARFSHRDVLLRRMIGAGGTGKVYEACLQESGEPVAVKFLRKALLRQPGVVRRFVAEAGTVAGLRHPHVVGVHGLGRTPAGAYFLVMDLIPGPNLDRVVAAGPVAVADAVRWASEVCMALELAHERGVVHCDLKPANLLLGRDGGVVVTDFGLARPLRGASPWATEVEGTAPYMAPEQASRAWGPVGVRTDVYGVGAVLFTLLTGRPPWPGRRLPDVLADVVSGAEVVAPNVLRPDLPGDVSDVCRACLCKPQEGRFATAREVREALAGLT